MAIAIEKVQDLRVEFKQDHSNLQSELKQLDQKSLLIGKVNDISKKYLGKSGSVTTILKQLKSIKDPAKKRELGSKINELRRYIETALSETEEKWSKILIERELSLQWSDPTRPGIQSTSIGKQHLVSKSLAEIEHIFRNMGFDVHYADEVDTAFNAFDTVNIPESHPARDNWDTLWLSDGNLGIPHTSAAQNRILQAEELPIKTVSIGKCFRNEATDATHEHTFYQLEGVFLDNQVSMADMLGVMLTFLENFFGAKIDYKFTPDHFPFVEPGGQLAIHKSAIGNDKLKSKSDYLEILGCGMIHPDVIEFAGKDPKRVSGFAWGMGIERILLLKYGIEDIRNFYGGDLRLIEQFN